MRATACPDTSGRTPLLYCTACAPTSPASRARIRRSCARGLNSWLNPPPASRQPPSPRVLREAMAAFLCVGRPPTARATSHAACQPCMCEWPARDPTPQWQCAVRSGEWASPSRSRQWRSALRSVDRASRIVDRVPVAEPEAVPASPRHPPPPNILTSWPVMRQLVCETNAKCMSVTPTLWRRPTYLAPYEGRGRRAWPVRVTAG